MPNYSNFDVYKVTSPILNGYLFSVTDNSNDEPLYHYYLISQENETLTIKKPTNIMDILNTKDINMIDINDSEEEYNLFTKTIERLLSHPLPTIEPSKSFSGLTLKDMNILRTY